MIFPLLYPCINYRVLAFFASIPVKIHGNSIISLLIQGIIHYRGIGLNNVHIVQCSILFKFNNGDDYILILYLSFCMFQVYFQLDSQRELLRTLRRLLKEKFADSKQDCSPNAFVKNQEVIVKWKDDEWARAR